MVKHIEVVARLVGFLYGRGKVALGNYEVCLVFVADSTLQYVNHVCQPHGSVGNLEHALKESLHP